ncbi:ABC transporter ATP-binding protein [Mangrovicoccus algicola]|uniref:ABC transporter ATP-binding protein n=1 Tax=Mangrovicoccus algicola TaxID=2771008 RepID=A0A8J6YVL3_9RHOB|nr:ABC transporter ATP-binding protein [Mangrovicoccus algicola]MBE3638650.1 ABC transporter ATP-binding protein [Mangrovicoccus algicola]
MSAPAIRVTGTAFLGEAPLFSGLDFRAVAGGWTCILGPSGVGKSTLIRLIAGLETGARFDGTVAASDDAPLEGRVAWMAQQDDLLPWLSVAQNAGLGARLRGTGADAAAIAGLLRRAGLSDHAAKRPAQLSGGQRQRAALARTLMEDRPVVLLDEPFSALDARTRAEMQDLAFAMLEGRSVVLVTHDPGEAARLGSRIWLMGRDGLAEMPLPAAPPIRRVDDPGCLEVQGALLARMRGTP